MRTALAALTLAAITMAAPAAHAVTPLPARGDTSVYDAANVIDDATETKLEALDTELLQKTGVAQVIVTVPKLEGETIDQLAVRVQHDWGVGAKNKDESVVIALAVADRKVFIATGYGTEPYLPDGKVGAIRDHARPQLSHNDFSGGIYSIARETAAVAATAHDVTLVGAPPIEERARRDAGCAGQGATIVFFVIFILIAIAGRRGGGGGGFWTGAVLGSMWGRGFGGSDRGGGGWGDSGGGGFGGFGGGSGGGGGAGGDF